MNAVTPARPTLAQLQSDGPAPGLGYPDYSIPGLRKGAGTAGYILSVNSHLAPDKFGRGRRPPAHRRQVLD